MPLEPVAPRRVRAKAEDPPRRSRVRVVLRWVLGVLLLLAVCIIPYRIDQYLASEAKFALAAPEGSAPGGVLLEGIQYTPREEVLNAFANDYGRSVYLIPLQERRAKLRRIDWVRDATVSRRWPNRIAVRIFERKPLAFVILEPSASSSAAETALVDGEGVILRLPPRARFSLPVLKGIGRNDPLEARRVRVRQAAELIRQLQAYAGQISEIDVRDPSNLTVMQMVEGRPVTLRLGDRDYLARLERFLKNYPNFSQRFRNARAFDLRHEDRFLVEEGGR